MVDAFRAYGLKTLFAAPTDRVAKRLLETTGIKAETIHRLLGCRPPESYQRNEKNSLEGEVLVVDECSMIDIILMNSLLKAVPESMRLLLVGDTDQLPAVGAGNVLRDIIDFGGFPVIRLKRIFRQAQTSRIIMNAHCVNAGKMSDISNGKMADFFFIECEDADAAAAKIVELVKTKLPDYYHIQPQSIQVLTPMQRRAGGAASLNLALQEALNPTGDGLHRSGFVFRSGDKVMQIKNNYDKEVFNGDIGTVQSVNILMLQRNLIYTGITRAKKILVVVSTKKALAYAVGNVTVTKRNTLLKERLSGERGRQP